LFTLAHVTDELQAPQNAVLVQCAISARPSNYINQAFEVEVYADLVKIKRSSAKIKPQRVLSHTPTRGVVTRFSRKSRKRMIEQLAKLRSVNNAHFITLTYPDDVAHSTDKAKRDLKAMQLRIMRRFPNAGGIWRMEIKPRLSGELVGQRAPHFHVLLFGAPMHEVIFRRWLQLAWSEIVYETDRPPRRVRTSSDKIENRKHAARYASKYAAKEENAEFDNCNNGLNSVTWGRRWGSFGKLDTSCQLVVTLTGDRVVELRRMVARWMKARGSHYAKRLARGSPNVGFSALGLGDQSCSALELFDSTIVRMIFAEFD